MSFTYGFYESKNGDRTYKARQFARLFDGLITDGVFMTVGDCFAVKPSSGMSVSIGTGKAWFNHTWSENDTEMIVTAEKSDMLLPRIDALVLEVDETESVRANSIKFITGTAATNPVKPTLTNTEYVHQHAFKYITIPANSTEITADNIENVIGTSECPFVTGILEGMDIDELVAQWEAQFGVWFDKIKGQLDEDAAGNLQNQVDVRWSLDGGNEIPENSDLNNYLEPGNYYCPLSVTAETLSNAPTNGAFTLKVERSTGDGPYIKQYLVPYNNATARYERYIGLTSSGAINKIIGWDNVPYMNQVATAAQGTNSDNHIKNTSNPHGVTKSQIGLSNVTNNKQMPIAGGTFTGSVGYTTSNSGVVKSSSYSFRNIAVVNSSGTAQSTGNIRMVRK